MKHWITLALTILVVGCGEKKQPGIYKFVNESPSCEKREALPWLTIISWRYDGASNNGMPLQEVNDRMITLEDAMEDDPAAWIIKCGIQ